MSMQRHLGFSLALLTGAAVIAGCARPVDVRVVVYPTGQPIEGARVTRSKLHEPYFIISYLERVEEKVTGADGVAHLKDRAGGIRVEADGFHDEGAIPKDEDLITVEMHRQIRPLTTRQSD